MKYRFDHTKPIYLQVATMIRDAILSGALPEGDAIPSVRQISVEQELNPQTVLNATHMLMEEGALEKQRGIGIFVIEGARKILLERAREAFREDELPAIVDRAQLLGLSAKDTAEMVNAAFKERS